MDKNADRINRLTLDFSSKVYEDLLTIVYQREDLRYFNYDQNDENIDSKLKKMFELIDDIYNSSIEKKTGWISRKPALKPNKLVFSKEDDMPEVNIHTPSPRTPTKYSEEIIEENPTPQAPIKKKSKKSKKKKIKVDEIENDKNILELIMYSSDENNSDFETL